MSNDELNSTRKINTLHFGEVNVQPHHIFTFKDGVLGFEFLREFVLISEEGTQPFKWLINLENPEIGFPVLSPWYVENDYNPGRDIDLDRLVLFCIVTLGDESGRMTINLKAPVVLDIENQTGWQVILPADKYSTSHVIAGG